MSDLLLEVIRARRPDAHRRQEGGADRLELVSDMAATADPRRGHRARGARRHRPAVRAMLRDDSGSRPGRSTGSGPEAIRCRDVASPSSGWDGSETGAVDIATCQAVIDELDGSKSPFIGLSTTPPTRSRREGRGGARRRHRAGRRQQQRRQRGAAVLRKLAAAQAATVWL